MTELKDLPVEIIEELLMCDSLNIYDILCFASTCVHFHQIVSNSNAIWKLVYSKRWPQFLSFFEQKPGTKHWYNEVKYVFDLIKRAHIMLADMSPKFYKRYELSDSDLSDWKDLMMEHPLAYHYLVQELMAIVNNQTIISCPNTVPFNTPGNLTRRYYARKALRFLRQQHLTTEWTTYMSLPADQQILERGAVIIAQWCQPSHEVSLADISQQFDHIADCCRDLLQSTYPNHPIFSTPLDVQNKWKTHCLSCNQWSMNECCQVMEIMAVVLYKHFRFQGNTEMDYIPENLYLNEVLEKRRGLPISLAIVYESVARRLGVHCEPVNFPAHLLLRWTFGPKDSDYYYVDAYNKGHISMQMSCPEARNSRRSAYTPASCAQQVMIRMANNLEMSGRHYMHPNGRVTRLRSVLELLRLLNSADLTCMLNLAKLYMLYNMNVTELTTCLLSQDYDNNRRAQAHQIVQMLQDHAAHHKDSRNGLYPQVEVAPRTPKLKFAVGMVMRHLRLGYTCVVYDWDPICLASADWQQQMSVQSLSKKDKQPFYNVLVEDGSHRYVAQENITPSADPRLLKTNEDLGSHFSHFWETHFVPNAEKEKEYPEDEHVRKLYHDKLMFGLT